MDIKITSGHLMKNKCKAQLIPKTQELHCINIQGEKSKDIELSGFNILLLIFLTLNIFMLFVYLFVMLSK